MKRNVIIVAIAAACHSANRAYCIGIGDNSQPEWKDAPEDTKKSAIAGVERALEGATPEKMHEAWVAHKRADGWRYGPVKDPVKKEHPCIVAYEKLPALQRKKDELFLAVVSALAPVLGLVDPEPKTEAPKGEGAKTAEVTP